MAVLLWREWVPDVTKREKEGSGEWRGEKEGGGSDRVETQRDKWGENELR